jgi:hypothetical protein
MNKRDKELVTAREAFIARGFWPNDVMWACWRDAWLAGSAIEREACAKVCESHINYPSRLHFAEAIRARGNT